MANLPPSDHSSASPSASTRARTSRRTTNKPDKFGIISLKDVNVPFKSFPGDNQSYKYHCRHGLFNHRDASYRFPPVVFVCHHGSQLTGARKDKLCLCEVDRGWISHAQGGDDPVPILGTEDNDGGEVIRHDMLGAGGNIPKGPDLQDCDDGDVMGDIRDEPAVTAQQVDNAFGHVSDSQLSIDNSAVEISSGASADSQITPITGSYNADNAGHFGNNEILPLISTTTTAATITTTTTTTKTSTTTTTGETAGAATELGPTVESNDARDGEPGKQVRTRHCTAAPV